MNDERLEPTVTHEYRAQFAREMNPETGLQELVVTLTTTRELVSLGYTINLTSTHDTDTTTIQIGGIGVARQALSRVGGAVGRVARPWPAVGTYTIVFDRKGKRDEVTLDVTSDSVVVRNIRGDAIVDVADERR